MIDSLSRCAQCNSPVTDSIQIEIENHGRVKLGKRVNDLWLCNDCTTKRSDETTSIILDDDSGIHHEHIGDASKSDVSPNTPPADEANL
jgi:Zn-finger protein